MRFGIKGRRKTFISLNLVLRVTSNRDRVTMTIHHISVSYTFWYVLNWTSFLTLTAICVILAYWRWSNSRFVILINQIPGPKTVPIIGNILPFININRVGK